MHHIEENPTRLCMPSHWTGETDSLEVELSKRDRSKVPTPYCLFKGGRKRLWDHSTFIAFQSYSDFARKKYETKVFLKYARCFFPTYPNWNFVERKADSLGEQRKERKHLLTADFIQKRRKKGTRPKQRASWKTLALTLTWNCEKGVFQCKVLCICKRSRRP